ncbi:MAG: nucleotidyl transferase AbiEii/AbiGii toxin family protein [Albidovulum sp.]|nr:nucleotidyl transferase AbiEii/AbiGii toxin family protein [Albidovulum sp.]
MGQGCDLHGLRRWFENRGELRGHGQRVSRHYYDVYRLWDSDAGRRALEDRELGADFVVRARMFFSRPAFDLATATPPTFSVCPVFGMLDDLRRDYRAMSGMIFGDAPEFEAIIEVIAELETKLNAPATGE